MLRKVLSSGGSSNLTPSDQETKTSFCFPGTMQNEGPPDPVKVFSPVSGNNTLTFYLCYRYQRLRTFLLTSAHCFTAASAAAADEEDLFADSAPCWYLSLFCYESPPGGADHQV